MTDGKKAANTAIVCLALTKIAGAIDRATDEKHARNNIELPAKMAERALGLLPGMRARYEHVSIICSNSAVALQLHGKGFDLALGPNEWALLFASPIQKKRLIYIDTAVRAHISQLVTPDNECIDIEGATDIYNNMPLVSFDHRPVCKSVGIKNMYGTSEYNYDLLGAGVGCAVGGWGTGYLLAACMVAPGLVATGILCGTFFGLVFGAEVGRAKKYRK